MPLLKVLLFGTFDHFHPGHQFVLDEARKRGDVHIVIARDATVEKIKGRAPDHSEAERQSAVKNACPSAEVILGDEKDYLQPLRMIEPDLIILGYDQKLPPGIKDNDLPCTVERLEAFEPEKFKSSLMRTSL